MFDETFTLREADGWIHRTICEVVLGKGLEKLVGDWRNHLSMTVIPFIMHIMDHADILVTHNILIGLNPCGSATNAALDTWQYRSSRYHDRDLENSAPSKVIFGVLETENKRNVYKRMSTSAHTPLAKQWGVWAEAVGRPLG